MCMEFDVNKEKWNLKSTALWKLASTADQNIDQLFGIYSGGHVMLGAVDPVETPYFWAFGYQYDSFMLTRFQALTGDPTHDFYWTDPLMSLSMPLNMSQFNYTT